MPSKPTRPPGRPTALAAAHHRIAVLEREVERMRTLKAAASGEFDPRAVLAEIAVDISAPPMARVSAARALLGRSVAEVDDDEGVDDLTRRALAMARVGHDG